MLPRPQPSKPVDVQAGITLAAQDLAKALEPDKLLVFIGDASTFNRVALVLNDIPGQYVHAGMQVRAIHYGQASAGVAEWLDPRAQEIVGANGAAKLQALTAAVVAAAHEAVSSACERGRR